MDALGQTGYEVRRGGRKGEEWERKKKGRNSFCFLEFHFRAERKKEKKKRSGCPHPWRRGAAQRSRGRGGAGGVAAAPGAPEQVRAEPPPCARRRRRAPPFAPPPAPPRRCAHARAPRGGGEPRGAERSGPCLGAATPGGAER